MWVQMLAKPDHTIGTRGRATAGGANIYVCIDSLAIYGPTAEVCTIFVRTVFKIQDWLGLSQAIGHPSWASPMWWLGVPSHQFR